VLDSFWGGGMGEWGPAPPIPRVDRFPMEFDWPPVRGKAPPPAGRWAGPGGGWLDSVGVLRKGSVPAKLVRFDADSALLAFDHVPVKATVHLFPGSQAGAGGGGTRSNTFWRGRRNPNQSSGLKPFRGEAYDPSHCPRLAVYLGSPWGPIPCGADMAYLVTYSMDGQRGGGRDTIPSHTPETSREATRSRLSSDANAVRGKCGRKAEWRPLETRGPKSRSEPACTEQRHGRGVYVVCVACGFPAGLGSSPVRIKSLGGILVITLNTSPCVSEVGRGERWSATVAGVSTPILVVRPPQTPRWGGAVGEQGNRGSGHRMVVGGAP